MTEHEILRVAVTVLLVTSGSRSQDSIGQNPILPPNLPRDAQRNGLERVVSDSAHFVNGEGKGVNGSLMSSATALP